MFKQKYVVLRTVFDKNKGIKTERKKERKKEERRKKKKEEEKKKT